MDRWNHTRRDDETRASDDAIVEFFTDGPCTVRYPNSLFATPCKPAVGRSRVTNLRCNQFDLYMARELLEPECDPSDAEETQAITVVNPETLAAADASAICRFKE